MVVRGEALIGSFTIAFTIHGQRNDWQVTVTAPGGSVSEYETQEATWFPLFNEMLAAASENASQGGTAMTTPLWLYDPRLSTILENSCGSAGQ